MAVDVQIFSDLDAVAADARGRLDRAAQPRLFDRLDWFRLTLAHCPPPGAPMVVRAEAGAAAAWAFLMIDGGSARLLGSWYTLAADIVRYPARSPAVIGELIAVIAGALRRRRIHRLVLTPVAAPDVLAVGFRAAGWWTRTSVATWSWAVDTSAGWDTYWSGRPARLRATERRKARAAALDIRILNTFDATAWADYEAIYADSWKPAEGAPAFLRALAALEGASGTLRLGLAYKEGHAIAAQLWLVEAGHATIHKLAHRRDADALSPGTILSAAIFRHVIETAGVREIDFGTGDEPYKADWMDRRTPLHIFEAYDPRRPAGLAGWSRAALSEIVRRLRRR